jgi:hypothetical protein
MNTVPVCASFISRSTATTSNGGVSETGKMD